MAWVSMATQALLLSTLTHHTSAHGRLLEPPSRSSMWRMGYNTPPNYDDNQLFCGGVQVQYEVNGGKCGVCGDPWNGVRENEAGGKYATGIIVRSYNVSQLIGVRVELTANHKGYFEFRLCPSDDPFTKVSQECLDQYPLVVDSVNKVRYEITSEDYDIELKLRLPENVHCRACLLQWKYNAGNSRGRDPDGTECIGCGNQEQFYGCADISIEGRSIEGSSVEGDSFDRDSQPKSYFFPSAASQCTPVIKLVLLSVLSFLARSCC